MRGKKFNKHFFDVIDDEEKAYWLGFLWADGYVGRRDRKNRQLEYNLKLDLATVDKGHLVKFKESLESEHPIKEYSYKGFEGKLSTINRIFITNTHIGETLRDKYGLIPRRHEFLKYSHLIPFELSRHFIRGVFDGDGSLCYYKTPLKSGKLTRKMNVIFTSYPEILSFVEDYLIETNSCANNKRKLYKRHEEEDRDKHCRSLNFSGRVQGMSVLDEIYRDATVYLDRKYEKYLKAKEFMA